MKALYFLMCHIPSKKTHALFLGRQNGEKKIFPQSWLHRERIEPNFQFTHLPFPAYPEAPTIAAAED